MRLLEPARPRPAPATLSDLPASGSRHDGIDFIKAWAILAVLWQHTIPRSITEDALGALWVRPAVPVFFVLMGLNLGASLLRSDGTELERHKLVGYWRRRLDRIAVPYLAVLAVGYAIALALGTLVASPSLVIGAMPVNAPGNYFIPALIGIVVAFPIIAWMYARRPLLTLVGAVAVNGAFEAVAAVARGHGDGGLLGPASLFYQGAPMRYLAVVMLGLCLARPRGRATSPQRLLAVLAPIGALYLVLQAWRPELFPFPDGFLAQTNLLAAPWAALLVVLVLRHVPSDLSGRRWGRAVVGLGRASYHVYLVQMLVLGVVADRLWAAGFSTTGERVLIAPAEIIACVALGYVYFRLVPSGTALIDAVRSIGRSGLRARPRLDRVIRRRRPPVSRLERRRDVPRLLEALRFRDVTIDKSLHQVDLGGRVRADAAAALGRLGDRRAVDGLARALSDEFGATRRNALTALAAIDPVEGVDIIAAAALGWTSPDDAAANADAVAVLERLAATDDEVVHRVAIVYLDGDAGGPEGVQTVHTLMAGADPQVRTTVIADATRRIRVGDASSRDRAGRLLEALSDESAPDVSRALRSDGGAHSGEGARVLGGLGDVSSTPALLELLDSADADTRRSAAESLGRILDPAAVEGLLAAASDPDHSVRRAATEALHALGPAATVYGMAAVARSLLRELEPGQRRESLARLLSPTSEDHAQVNTEADVVGDASTLEFAAVPEPPAAAPTVGGARETAAVDEPASEDPHGPRRSQRRTRWRSGLFLLAAAAAAAAVVIASPWSGGSGAPTGQRAASHPARTPAPGDVTAPAVTAEPTPSAAARHAAERRARHAAALRARRRAAAAHRRRAAASRRRAGAARRAAPRPAASRPQPLRIPSRPPAARVRSAPRAAPKARSAPKPKPPKAKAHAPATTTIDESG